MPTLEDLEIWRDRCAECGHPRHQHVKGEGACLVDGCETERNDFKAREHGSQEYTEVGPCLEFVERSSARLRELRKATGKWRDA